ncbi:transposase [Halobacteriovorax sp. JY17]|uniref:transposase n=1 Tax=Halobacteriovorax sp. JY17 TaxID=2014617 RepID=UPI000C584F24|nr:transposase [Halobacteriovorax sp. JY17]PIK14729.1 MAG: hypothetical protein CES88_10345 [Halobacteriovorax sp. JY17]
MPRKKIIRTHLFPYHVTIRTNNKEWFKIPLPEVWKITQIALDKCCQKVPVDVHAFVLMNNHYHMILSTPSSDLDLFMRHFNRMISDMISRRTGVINRKFGGPYRWTIIDNRKYAFNVFRYVYRNPVRAGLCKRVEDYPFSSLNDDRDFSYTTFLDEQRESLINFFNKNAREERVEDIRNALRKTYFKPALDKNTLRPKKILEY